MASAKPIDISEDDEPRSVLGCDDSDIFVIDEVGSSVTSCTATEDEPEIIFVKETSSSPLLSAPADEIQKETHPKSSQNDEPEIICLDQDGDVAEDSMIFKVPGEHQAPPMVQDSKASESTNDSQDPVLTEEPGLFCLDTTPEVPSGSKPLGPRFRREFSSTLKFEEETTDSKEDVAKNDNRCFNCLGDHTMASCPSPKNYAEISKNRSAFMRNMPKLTNRYHEDKGGKFDQFKPGVLSRELREALGLRSSEIPLHIYQMRILGYPPGWLEEMKETCSGLELIDSESNAQHQSNQNMTYNFDRVIDYPGFNVPLDPRFRDDWRYLNFPPMQPFQAKETFIETLKRQSAQNGQSALGNNGYHSSKTPESNVECVDLDTSIEDLEEQRQLLLAKLDGGSSGEVSLDGSDVVHENGVQLSETQESSTISMDDTKNACTSTPNLSTTQTESDTSAKESKLLAMGTPVSIRFSPYNTLPALDKFARNMGDMELFENLPGSTGAFQRMRSLLAKVRKAFKKKH